MKEETVILNAQIIYRFSFIIAVVLINALYTGVTLSTYILQYNLVNIAKYIHLWPFVII